MKANVGGTQLVIGNRVLIGQAIMGLVNFGVWIWNITHPERQMPGEIAGAMAQPIIFLAQIYWVNRFGITTKES